LVDIRHNDTFPPSTVNTLAICSGIDNISITCVNSYCSDTLSIRYRYNIDTVSIQYRNVIDTLSIDYRYVIATISMWY
jgi:hypothetical protein